MINQTVDGIAVTGVTKFLRDAKLLLLRERRSETNMPVTADRPAPYATAGAILDFIDRYRNRGVPSPIDGDVLARAGVAHTLIARTLQALHTLDLIDPKTGTPTQTLEA